MVCLCLLQPGNIVFLLRPRGDLQLSAVNEDGQLQHAQIQARFRLSEVNPVRLYSAMPDMLLICFSRPVEAPAVGVVL